MFTSIQQKGFLVLLILLLAPQFSLAGGNGQVNLPFPEEPCERAWQEAKPSDFLFDFSNDTVSGSHGSDGYSRYLSRMKDHALTDRKDCYKTWTVLIYMAATKDLVPYAYADLLEMESGTVYDQIEPVPSIVVKDPVTSEKLSRGSTLRSDIIVQLDTDLAHEISRLHMFQAETSKYANLKKDDLPNLTRADVQSPIVSTISKDLPTTEHQRLEDFLKWGIQTYPSEHYLVLIWGHGQGWTAIQSTGKPAVTNERSSEMNGKFGGLGLEVSTGYLDIPELKTVLDEVKTWRGGAPIDVFVTDACLMQEMDVVCQLKDCTNYCCGSEEIQPLAGGPYGTITTYINNVTLLRELYVGQSHDDGEAGMVGCMIPRAIQASYAQGGSQADIDPNACHYFTSCTVSMFHLQRSLLRDMDALAGTILSFIEEKQERYIDIKELMQQGTFYKGGTRDLGGFLKALEDLLAKEKPTAASVQLTNALNKARYALNDTVVSSALGDHYTRSPDPWKQAEPKGLSIWLPKIDSDFHDRIADYSQSAFYQLPNWRAFLTRMYPQKRR